MMRRVFFGLAFIGSLTAQDFSRSVGYYFKVLPPESQERTTPKKSKAAAIGFSAILPGSGQFYLNSGKPSLIRGAVYGALEVTSWVIYFSNRSSGLDQKHKFENYANKNWDENKYLAFLEGALNLTDGSLGRKTGSEDNINYSLLVSAESDWGELTGVSVHHLHKSGRQQYYEMIYKYPEQFGQGWSDADAGLITPDGHTGYTYLSLTPTMKKYKSMRNQSNLYYDRARAMLNVMLANRVLSIMDIVISNRNNPQATTSIHFRLEPVMYGSRISAIPSLQFHF